MFPIQAQSKKQTAVSHSTPEAEIVAADLAVRTVGLPALSLWDVLGERENTLIFHEDNAAMIQVCRTGKNPTMRHLGRTHRIDVHWLHERFAEPGFKLIYEQTKAMRADILTKGFVEEDKWGHALELINHVNPKTFWEYDPTVVKIKPGTENAPKAKGKTENPEDSAVPGIIPQEVTAEIAGCSACVSSPGNQSLL